MCIAAELWIRSGFGEVCFPLKVTPVLQSWYLKWLFWAGFRPLSPQPVNRMTLVARGTSLACSPKVCSVPGEASVPHAGFPHSTSKGSWDFHPWALCTRQSSQPPCTLRLQNYHSCAEVATFPCEAAPVPVHPPVPGQSSPEGPGKCWSCSCLSACHQSYKEFEL